MKGLTPRMFMYVITFGVYEDVYYTTHDVGGDDYMGRFLATESIPSLEAYINGSNLDASSNSLALGIVSGLGSLSTASRASLVDKTGTNFSLVYLEDGSGYQRNKFFEENIVGVSLAPGAFWLKAVGNECHMRTNNAYAQMATFNMEVGKVYNFIIEVSYFNLS